MLLSRRGRPHSESLQAGEQGTCFNNRQSTDAKAFYFPRPQQLFEPDLPPNLIATNRLESMLGSRVLLASNDQDLCFNRRQMHTWIHSCDLRMMIEARGSHWTHPLWFPFEGKHVGLGPSMYVICTTVTTLLCQPGLELERDLHHGRSRSLGAG